MFSSETALPVETKEYLNSLCVVSIKKSRPQLNDYQSLNRIEGDEYMENLLKKIQPIIFR